MRLLPRLALCLVVLPACKIEPTDPGTDVDPPEPVAEDEFAARAAETLCAELFACQCSDNLGTPEIEPLPWADEAACVAEKQPEYQALLEQALATGGTYSDECGGQLIADFERATDCQSTWAYYVGGGHFYDPQACPLAVVERQVGDPCDPYAYNINDCGEAKLCTYDFVCVPSGELPVAEGDSCYYAGIDLPCAPGLFCSEDDQGATCKPPPELGDPCPDYACFGADLTCDYETLTCIANAGEGESCEQVECSAGLYCDGGQGTTCVAQYEYGHGCATDSVCADGGRCINNVCTEPPAAVCMWL